MSRERSRAVPKIDNAQSGGVPGDPLKKPLDGFDPLIPYQMVPLGRSKEMVVHTGNFKADLKLKNPGIAAMTNFRILRQAQPSPFPLPPPGFIVLPERSVVQFTLAGQSVGMTVLEGRDLPPGGAPLKSEINLLVSVKTSQRREFAICYLFDRVNRDVGARRDFPGHFVEVNNIFERQTNFNLVNADGASSGTRAARTLTLRGTMGRVFDLDDDPQIGRLIDAFDAKFPGVSANMHAVVFSVPVPIRSKSNPRARILGVSVKWRRQSTGRSFNTLFVGPQDPPRKSAVGGNRPSAVQNLQNTIAHEIGHSLGLGHDPDFLTPELLEVIEVFNPEFLFEPQNFNLMFPFAIGSRTLSSNRINGAQVEIMHQLGPQFREATT
jgi:hypothetical protein